MSLEAALADLAAALGAMHLKPASKVTPKNAKARWGMVARAAGSILGEGVRISRDSHGRRVLVLDEDSDGSSDEEAVQILRTTRRMHLSIRNMYTLPRLCRKSSLTAKRKELTAYKGTTVSFQPGVGRIRAGCYCNLSELLEARVRLAEVYGGPVNAAPFRVLLCADATPFWRTSATRGDAYIDLSGNVADAGVPRKWGLWFAFDGSDDVGPLRVADQAGKLNEQVQHVQRVGISARGGVCPCLCYYTADGHGMQSANHRAGLRCWNCSHPWDSLDNFLPQDTVEEKARWGAFLPDIPPTRRVGDCVHCACRVSNAVPKRLLADPRVASSPEACREIKRIVHRVALDAAHIPSDQRVAPRPTKVGSFDLTSARLFLERIEIHAEFVAVLAKCLPSVRVAVSGVQVAYAIVMQRMLAALWYIQKTWRLKENFSDVKVAGYHRAVCEFATLWKALQWKPTVWIHWVVHHSPFFARTLRNFYFFSSIPVERRNVEFKLDVRHCFQGWKLSRPYLTWRALQHVLELGALDVGLQIEAARIARRKEAQKACVPVPLAAAGPKGPTAKRPKYSRPPLKLA